MPLYLRVINMPDQSPDSQSERSARVNGSILVVDDDVAVLQVLGNFFEREGLEVFRAVDGSEAIEILVHEDWARTCSKRTPRSARRASSGEVSSAKP